MNKLTTLYELCDVVLNELNVNTQKTIDKLLPNNNDRQLVFEQLKDDKYIIYTDGAQSYSLTPKGEFFIKTGGYSKHLEREEKQKEYTEQLKTSTIDTNSSVRKTNLIVITTSIITVMIVSINAAISFLQYRKDEEIKIKINEDQYKEQLLLQKSILKSQEDLKKIFLPKDTLDKTQ